MKEIKTIDEFTKELTGLFIEQVNAKDIKGAINEL